MESHLFESLGSSDAPGRVADIEVRPRSQSPLSKITTEGVKMNPGNITWCSCPLCTDLTQLEYDPITLNNTGTCEKCGCTFVVMALVLVAPSNKEPILAGVEDTPSGP